MMNVYLIGNTEYQLFKIGISQDVERRMCQLERSGSFPLSVFATHDVEWKTIARAVEAKLHSHYEDKHVHREWFRDIDLEDFKSKATQFTATWLLSSSGEKYLELEKEEERQRILRENEPGYISI